MAAGGEEARRLWARRLNPCRLTSALKSGGRFLSIGGAEQSLKDLRAERNAAYAACMNALAVVREDFGSPDKVSRVERPLLHLRPLRQPSYIGGVMLFALCYVLLGANNYMLPVLMQRTLGYAWQTVGQFQTLGLLSALASWGLMARLLPRFPGAKKFFVIGFIALATFGWQLSRLNTEANLWRDILPALAWNGVFLIFVMATTAMQTFRDVQHHETVFSHAQQLKNMMAQFGMALGIVSVALFQQWRTAEHYVVLNSRYSSGAAVYQQQLQQLAEALAGTGPQALPQAAAQLAQQLAQQAALLACLDYLNVIVLIGLGGALLMAVQQRMK